MVCAMPNGVLCVVRTWPLPLQSGQTSGVVPGAQPVVGVDGRAIQQQAVEIVNDMTKREAL